MTNATDEELIKATLGGEKRAFADLVRRYERRVAVIVRSVVGNLPSDDLADIAQDIFVLVYRSLKSFRGESQFSTWLTRIALRHCYRESKRQRKRSATFLSYNATTHSDDRSAEERFAGRSQTDRGVIAEERRNEVIAALQSLSEEFRTVLVLRIVEELSVEEVAAALEISTGTVKSRLYRAKEKMRGLLEGNDLEFQLDIAD